MRLRYSSSTGSAYLELFSADEPVRATANVRVTPPGSTESYLVLDFDATGRLVGVDFLDAHKQLLPSVLSGAD
jgi:uncharacterized protein YuzE